jgi:trimeric autotransporter adhesin
MATGANNLIAAQLSNAAYTPLATYQSGGALPASAPVPAGWVADPALSGNDGTDANPGGNNQFITFVNTTTNQVMITFKGTDNLSNGVSDIASSGGTAWQSIQPVAQAALFLIQVAYPGYQIMTDGHSLGGGLAQSFALANNLSGYGQNSLPISSSALDSLLPGSVNTLASNLAAWQASPNTFNETNMAGDPATIYYSYGSGPNLPEHHHEYTFESVRAWRNNRWYFVFCARASSVGCSDFGI